MYNTVIIGDNDFKNMITGNNKISDSYFSFNIKLCTDSISEAIRIIKKKNIDIVFIDISGIRIKGIGFLKEIKQEFPSIAVVIADNEPDFEYARQAIIYGAFDYLIKPLEAEKLSEVIKRYSDMKEPHIKESISFVHDALIAALNRGNPTDVVSRMNLYFDTVRLEISGTTLNRARMDVLNFSVNLFKEIKNSFEWIDKFSGDFDIYKLNLLSCENTENIIELFKSYISDIINIIQKFVFISKNKSVREACRYMLCHADEKLCLERVAKNCFLNKSYLSHIFKEDAGISFVEYVTMIKIELAKKMFRETDMMVFEIAAALSFENTEYFSRKFKESVGITPNNFKKQYSNEIKSRTYLGA